MSFDAAGSTAAEDGSSSSSDGEDVSDISVRDPFVWWGPYLFLEG